MDIFIACPAPARSRKGNRVTADRWAHILCELGHRVTIGQNYKGRHYDLLVALHARRSSAAVREYLLRHPHGRAIVALTGTDLYRDIRTVKVARSSLMVANRLVVLQERGVDELEPRLQPKTRVIYQSAVPLRRPPAKSRRWFEVCVLGHLRDEKDPFRTALALRLLPEESRIRVIHAGKALSRAMEQRARALMKREPRYRWLGEVSAGQARRLLARSRLLVVSSRMEGGANVVSEALAEEVPVLASRIPGNVGILGARYPGYFPVGDTAGLARLLRRAETDAALYEQLTMACEERKLLVDPVRERGAWADLLRELT